MKKNFLLNLTGIKDRLEKAAKQQPSPTLTHLIRKIIIEWLNKNNL